MNTTTEQLVWLATYSACIAQGATRNEAASKADEAVAAFKVRFGDSNV